MRVVHIAHFNGAIPPTAAAAIEDPVAEIDDEDHGERDTDKRDQPGASPKPNCAETGHNVRFVLYPSRIEGLVS